MDTVAGYLAEKQFIKNKTKSKENSIPRTMVVTDEKYLAEQIKSENPTFLVFNHKTNECKLTDVIKANGQEYRPLKDDLVIKNVINLPTEASNYSNTEALRLEIKSFIHTYLDISTLFEEIASYYILLTWLFDRIDTISYLGIYGEYGSGKTRAAKTIGSLCYKSAMVSGSVTIAPIYRILEQSRGTLILNEFDFDNSDFNSEMIKILNNGYERGMHVLRTNKDSGKVECFDAFSPKIFTYRKKKKDLAFESRLITINITETHREDIPTILPPEFELQAQDLRNKLLMFRFNNFRKPIKVDSKLFIGIERRIRQTLYPLFTVVDDIDFQKRLIVFARDMQDQISQERGLSWEAEAFQILINLINQKQDISVGMYAGKLSDEKIFGGDEVNPRKAGSIVRNSFMLRTERSTSGDNKGQMIIQLDPTRIQALCQKFGIAVPTVPSLNSLPSPTPYQASEHREDGEHSTDSDFEQEVMKALI